MSSVAAVVLCLQPLLTPSSIAHKTCCCLWCGPPCLKDASDLQEANRTGWCMSHVLLVIGWGLLLVGCLSRTLTGCGHSIHTGVSEPCPGMLLPHRCSPHRPQAARISLCFLDLEAINLKREGWRQSQGGMPWTSVGFWRAVSVVPSPLCSYPSGIDVAHGVPVLPRTNLQEWRGHHALWCQNCRGVC